jgi:fatty acid desaturase
VRAWNGTAVTAQSADTSTGTISRPIYDDEGVPAGDGTLTESKAERRTSDYSQLSREIKDAGLLDRRPFYYWARIAVNVVLVAAAGVSLYLAHDSWWVLVVAVLWAVVSTQLAFTGHEAGHRQMFVSRRANELAGYLHGNLMIGLSYDWWVDKHNRHHRNPNQSELDPDIGTGAFVFSHDEAAKRGRIGKFAARWQAFFFFPLLALESLNLQVASIRAVAKTGARNRGVEAALLFTHVAGYLTLLFLTMSPLKALAFLGIHQALFGIYLGCSFAPNHKGMPILGPADQGDFLRRQVLTSRNVRGGWLTDLVLGGLNYQIEHHLFPSMPRPNLRRSQALVAAFCEQNGLPYCQSSLAGSYAQALRHLNTTGRAAHPAKVTSPVVQP